MIGFDLPEEKKSVRTRSVKKTQDIYRGGQTERNSLATITGREARRA
jgi:hypothetical protein